MGQERERAAGPLRHLPNFLSALRLILAVCFPWLPGPWRGPVVLAAGLSDWGDGYLARRCGWSSWSGGLLDAAADKAFTLAVLVTLVRLDQLSPTELGLLLIRDGVVLAISVYAAIKRDWHAFQRMPSRLLGKWTTTFFFALFVAHFLLPDATLLLGVLLVGSIALSSLSGLDYLVRFLIRGRELPSTKS